MRIAPRDPARADRRVDGLLQLALAAAVVLIASSLVRLAVTRFGYEPTLTRLHTAQLAEADADRGMLDQENGVRGFQLSADNRFLEPYQAGQHAFLVASAAARTNLAGFADLSYDWNLTVGRAQLWQQRYAAPAIAAVRPGLRPSVASLLGGTASFAEYQGAQGTAAAVLADAVSRQKASEEMFRTSTGITQAVALVLLAFTLIRRARRPREVEPAAPSRAGADPRTPSGFVVSGDLDALALSIATAGRELAGANAASLWLADGDELRRVEPGTPTIVAQRRRHDVALRAHREGAIITSVHRSRRNLAVPLLHEGRTLGVVELTLPAGSPPPTHAQIETLRAWGRQAAKAIAHGPGSPDRDPLTGFSGLPTLTGDLIAALEASVVSDRPVSLVVLEVDHLEHLAAAGTATRDDLIRTVGSVLADTVRASDTAYRTGEGSFAVLLPGAPANAAASLAERLRQIIARRFVERGVTASFGIATAPDVAQDEAALLEAAEAALYDARRFGGNRAQTARSLSDELAMVRRRSSELD